ncbi:MAG TPA: PCRF domain-containing protein, partial [Patescibacteria group bacterium]|nr:PCRF domain-containing protein [Patescibacteria group bacterium]
MEQKQSRIATLQKTSEQPNFWNDPKKAGRVMQEIETFNQELIAFERLQKTVSDMIALAALEHLTPEDEQALIKEYETVTQEIEEWEFKTLLGGQYDAHSALLTVRSGAGGV